MKYGATPLSSGGAQFRVWAPRVQKLAVQMLGELFPMTREGEDFEVHIPAAQPGQTYALVLDDAKERPDPVSRSQPHGVHGKSQIVDPGAFRWSDRDWKGIELEKYIVYELHVGTFTAEGTFEGAISRIPYLKQLGVTAIELMPVAEFPGPRNWGYDGVDFFAPHSAYGGSDGLKKLVNACHEAGLAVVLDVVYNHVGPEGNYLADFGPYFTNHYRTPWGPAINFDGPGSDGVRGFFIDNALYWLTEYHMDALRLDAIHSIYDFGAVHVLKELAERFHEQAARLGRQAWLTAESDLNDVRVIQREDGGYGLDAQWHDEFHHAVISLLTKSDRGFLGSFGRLANIQKVLAEGFVYDGIYSPYRQRRFGSSSKDLAGSKFVVFIQNHDQIANTNQGSRLSELVSLDQFKLAATLLLLLALLATSVHGRGIRRNGAVPLLHQPPRPHAREAGHRRPPQGIWRVCDVRSVSSIRRRPRRSSDRSSPGRCSKNRSTPRFSISTRTNRAAENSGRACPTAEKISREWKSTAS